MKNYILLLPCIILLLIFGTGNAQDPGILLRASENNLKKHVFYLASDSLQGRGINTPGLKLAADYLRKNLENKGLTPPEYGFFQPFVLTSFTFDTQNSFIRTFSKRGKVKGETGNFIALNQTADVTDVEGELIFAGYGTESSTENLLNEENINGKIVLYSAGTSQSMNDDNTYHWNNTLERKKMDAFIEAGAKALILVTNIKDSADATYRHFERMHTRHTYSLDAVKREEDSRVFIVTPETADFISGKKIKWNKVMKSLSETDNFSSYPLKNKKIHIRSVLTEKETIQNNVIGMVEGSDSILKNECVVFMAHYDHLGTGKNNEIYNGADDNASGAATLLEVAGMFSGLKTRPLRSILFLFPSAEEIGLFGSDYYTRNPVFSLANTVTCINLDMVGRVYEKRDSIWDHSPKQVKDLNGIYVLMNDFNPNLKSLTEKGCSYLEMIPDFSLPARFFYTSDHYHFHKNKVPVLNLSTGYSADYHKPGDTANRIRTDKMKRVAHLCFLLGMELANQE